MSNDFFLDNGSLIRYTGNTPVVVIPDGVREITREAFARHSEIISVLMPDSVVKLDFGAFMECTNLVNVRFSGTLQEIGKSAFHDCTALAQVDLPDSLRLIGGGAFFNCAGMRTLSISGSMPISKTLAFWQCENVETLIVRDPLCQTTSTMLEQLAHDLHSPWLRRISIADPSLLPNRWVPAGLAACVEAGLISGTPKEQFVLTFLHENLREVAPFAVRSPYLLDLMCRRKMIPARLIDQFMELAHQANNVQSIALLLEYRINGPIAAELERTRLRCERQASAIADRALSRLGQPGITGLVVTTAGKIPSCAYFHDRSSLRRWLESHGARLSDAVTGRVDYVVADGELPPVKKEQADNLGIPVMCWEELFSMADTPDVQP